MSNPPYDDKLLRQYLLGGLPEAEAEVSERLDDLSILDDEFAARLEAVEAELIDNYVRNELTEPELTRFRSLYLTAPHSREKVRFARAFQEIVARQPVARPVPVPWWRRWLASFPVPRWSWQWNWAALAFLLLVACGWLAFRTWQLRTQVQQGQAERAALTQREQELQIRIAQQQAAESATKTELARAQERLAQLTPQREGTASRAQRQPPAVPVDPQLAHFDLAPQTRGLAQPPDISLPRHTDYVVLQLELEADDAPTYRVTLSNQARRRLWQVPKLWARSRGGSKVLDVKLRARLLPPQRYRLQVSGISTDGAIESTRDYLFRVVP